MSKRKRHRPIRIQFPLSLALVPFLLIAGVLSIPIGLIGQTLAKARWRQLLATMRSQGRVVTFSEIAEIANNGGGTLIIERQLPKGPVRRWWTAEDIYTLCPYPYGVSPFSEAITWCRNRYTDANQGAAALVIGGRVIDPLGANIPDQLRWIDLPLV